ncbi:hypothetical protein [Motilimonas eburnea]|uniref:hypothetical protein n=1 Tax=Motilimonas eburnea TaxID=1737488 RepID=UPI001E5C4E6E|nr:hypothetical protein [Motilimonas eburnea]MCE2573070.1 hypothetical protein [Motilimonas eburnea]
MLKVNPVHWLTICLAGLASVSVFANTTYYSETCQTKISYHKGKHSRLVDTFSDPFGSGLATMNENNEPRPQSDQHIMVPFPGIFDKGRTFYGNALNLPDYVWECSEYDDKGICLGVCRTPQNLEYVSIYNMSVDAECVKLAGPPPEDLEWHEQKKYRQDVEQKCSTLIKRHPSVLESIKRKRQAYTKPD